MLVGVDDWGRKRGGGLVLKGNGLCGRLCGGGGGCRRGIWGLRFILLVKGEK